MSRILIVEDEFLIATTLEEMLIEQGHEIIGIAPTLQEGVRMASDPACQGALLDLNLNGEKSLPIADILQKRGVPFVYTTGYGDSIASMAGDVPILSKPYTQADVKHAIGLLGL